MPSQADLQWGMFPSPYLGAVGPDATSGSVVYRLSARQRDGALGQAQFLLLDGTFPWYFNRIVLPKHIKYNFALLFQLGSSNELKTCEMYEWTPRTKAEYLMKMLANSVKRASSSTVNMGWKATYRGRSQPNLQLHSKTKILIMDDLSVCPSVHPVVAPPTNMLATTNPKELIIKH